MKITEIGNTKFDKEIKYRLAMDIYREWKKKQKKKKEIAQQSFEDFLKEELERIERKNG
jgi:hypothetical protein